MRVPRWLMALILALVAANMLDVRATLTDAAQYSAFQLPFPPGLKVVYALLWIAVLLALATNLLRRRAWAFRWVAPLLTLYGIVGLIGQAVFVRSDYGRARLPFQFALTAILLLPVWWLAIRRRWLRLDTSGPRPDGDNRSARASDHTEGSNWKGV
jgi:hypothetical protein